jgi:hypothetical protein
MKWCVGIAVDAEGGKLYWIQKGSDNARSVEFFGRTSRSRQVSHPRIAKTLNFFMKGCLSQSIWTWTSPIAPCIGQTAGIRRVATR